MRTLQEMVLKSTRLKEYLQEAMKGSYYPDVSLPGHVLSANSLKWSHELEERAPGYDIPGMGEQCMGYLIIAMAEEITRLQDIINVIRGHTEDA